MGSFHVSCGPVTMLRDTGRGAFLTWDIYNSETLNWASLTFGGFCWCLPEGKWLLRGKMQTL